MACPLCGLEQSNAAECLGLRWVQLHHAPALAVRAPGPRPIPTGSVKDDLTMVQSRYARHLRHAI